MYVFNCNEMPIIILLMRNTENTPSMHYVDHILNLSPSKSAYSFTKQARFKTDTDISPSKDNKHISPIIKSSFRETHTNKGDRSDMVSMNRDQSQQRANKQDRQLQQKNEYYGYESKSSTKKDQYTIFPVRKSIDQLVKEMQELRFIFKSGIKQKKFISSQRKDIQKQNKRDNYKTYKADRDTQRHSLRAVTPGSSKNDIDSTRFVINKTYVQQQSRRNQRLTKSDVKDIQTNRRRSVSPFSNYIQSTFRNSSSFSFPTSPRRLFDTTTPYGDRKFDFYSPFSQFGPTKQRASQAY